ncbi:hypothetical protein MJO28_004902 [Puccinia striiformis f. sp. tritici]|uniref:Uncharacterized protein n=4 Tax=Puccinia striiformis TaxID=27350 RepID=A0A0L0VC07_9BASI|nr:hypothetical protein Pst134EA_009110 [Puccinia striiformis f. sp. tritici]KAI9609475.1 hypothetical protein H4Q26_007431 [Puccinia striiformis f. sp. tritici PST-130]KNE96815.1 hypothetical protein PSTG_09951 [Puccinia striiformis f. sp. tritici PST-78]POW14278.1 hypothetical protein PSTT_03046 [Puccinia striiformis]KAH9457860.1 hypothetical protein Pst134EB_010170 [Puccinia striiformis f. sp. tritici]KAH9468575.1 hypothetical protein Pst134EA_009110 [Puccinia striiformis f. sp. tritici]
MITPRFQLCIIVSAAQILNTFALSTSDGLLSDPVLYSTIPDITAPSESGSENYLDWASSTIPDETLSSVTQDIPTSEFLLSEINRSTNYTLKERGHGHRESDTPIKNLLGHGMGLGGILGDSDDGDDDNGFTGGWATYFTQNSIAGACGKVHADTDVIVALDYRRYGSLNKVSKYCGKKVSITSGDTTITATVADACPTCINRNCLDLSEGAFKKLGATVQEGMKPITWKFID